MVMMIDKLFRLLLSTTINIFENKVFDRKFHAEFGISACVQNRVLFNQTWMSQHMQSITDNPKTNFFDPHLPMKI